MKNKTLLAILPLLCMGVLASCNPTKPSSEDFSSEETSSESSSEEISSEESSEEVSSEESSSESIPEEDKLEIISKALTALQTKSHELEINQTYKLEYPGEKYYVGSFQKHNHKIGYYYEGENKAYRYSSNSEFADIDSMTGEIVESTYRTKIVPSTLYKKDIKNGNAVIETLGVDNVLTITTCVEYDPLNNIDVAIKFDSEFINPFTNINLVDVQYVNEHKLTLVNIQAANKLLKAYGILGSVSEGDEISLILDNEGKVTNLEFVLGELRVGNKVITNDVSLTFTKLDNIDFPHVRPYENNNPDLVEAFNKYADLTNYTYTKTIEVDGMQADHVEGYFSQDVVLFHHGLRTDTALYENGDNYDLKCVYNPTTQVYDVYQYIFAADDFDWVQVFATDNVPYTMPTFTSIGATFNGIVNPAVFKNIGDNKYQVEDLVFSTIGQYFDFGVWGVDSFFLETQTLDCVITLTDNNEIDNIKVYAHMEKYEFVFTFKYRDIGSTVIPEWIDPKATIE